MPRSTYYRQKQPKPEPKPQTSSSRRAARALSPEEYEEVCKVLYSERFIDKSPREIWATLIDEGIYLCSWRTMYRILQENGQSHERRRGHRRTSYTKPELLATGPNQVWSWDITKLKGPVTWTYYYLYVIIDIYSRYVVGWMLADRESAKLARQLIEQTCDRQGIQEEQLILHSDRGPAMKSRTVGQLLMDLGVCKSHSRPHVSDDNPFSEAQFKTLKYHPYFPKRFESQKEALLFCRTFFGWYNDEHKHSGIGLITPFSRHHGLEDEILEKRQEVMSKAYEQQPHRFVHGKPLVKGGAKEVWINPPKEKEEVVEKPLTRRTSPSSSLQGGTKVEFEGSGGDPTTQSSEPEFFTNRGLNKLREDLSQSC
mgnify:CR=1 FL=1